MKSTLTSFCLTIIIFSHFLRPESPRNASFLLILIEVPVRLHFSLSADLAISADLPISVQLHTNCTGFDELKNTQRVHCPRTRQVLAIFDEIMTSEQESRDWNLSE
jgi:hypothetical protein